MALSAQSFSRTLRSRSFKAIRTKVRRMEAPNDQAAVLTRRATNARAIPVFLAVATRFRPRSIGLRVTGALNDTMERWWTFLPCLEWGGTGTTASECGLRIHRPAAMSRSPCWTKETWLIGITTYHPTSIVQRFAQDTVLFAHLPVSRWSGQVVRYGSSIQVAGLLRFGTGTSRIKTSFSPMIPASGFCLSAISAAGKLSSHMMQPAGWFW